MLFQDKASAMGGHLRGKAAAAKRDQDREPSSGQLDAVYAPCDSVESVLLLMHRIAQDPCGDVIAVTVEHQCMLWRLVLRREAEAGKSNEKNDAERKNRMASMMQAIAQRSRMAEEHVRARAREQIAERANVVNTSQVAYVCSSSSSRIAIGVVFNDREKKKWGGGNHADRQDAQSRRDDRVLEPRHAQGGWQG